jgi:uncharacterized membrane protein YjgN (DUF898 family)
MKRGETKGGNTWSTTFSRSQSRRRPHHFQRYPSAAAGGNTSIVNLLLSIVTLGIYSA